MRYGAGTSTMRYGAGSRVPDGARLARYRMVLGSLLIDGSPGLLGWGRLYLTSSPIVIILALISLVFIFEAL